MIKFEDIKVGLIIKFQEDGPKPMFSYNVQIRKNSRYKVINIGLGITRTGKKQYDTTATFIKVSKDNKQIGNYKHYYCMNFLMEKATNEEIHV